MESKEPRKSENLSSSFLKCRSDEEQHHSRFFCSLKEGDDGEKDIVGLIVQSGHITFSVLAIPRVLDATFIEVSGLVGKYSILRSTDGRVFARPTIQNLP